MTGFLKIFFIVLIVLYIINPFDLVPDLIAVFGWLDDLILLGVLVYFFRKGRFPDLVSRFEEIFKFRRYDQEQHDKSNRSKNQRAGSASAPESNISGDDDPFNVLGVAPGASVEDIKAAYRKAAHACHPDKVSHLDEEFQQLAQEKFIKIKKAYEQLIHSKH